jgi:hypothetical protein
LEIQRAAARRDRERVLRQERRIVWRKRFDWTMRHEMQRRRGSRIVCSKRCGIAAADEHPQEI